MSVEHSDLGDIEVAEEPSLTTYAVEDWAGFAFFWALAVIVFLQFFTRYILNDSLAWTEEIARYLLTAVTFVGAATATRKHSHIFVEFFYVYLHPRVAFALSTLVDLMVVFFYGLCTLLAWRVANVMQFQFMVVFDRVPLAVVYYIVTIGFAAMTLRTLQTAWRHWSSGESPLTRVRAMVQ